MQENNPPPPARRRPKIHTGTETRTVQSDGDLVDINRIISELVSGGAAPSLNRTPPAFADVYSSTDLQTHIMIARQVNEDFALLPASVRSAAGNNPVQFLDMLADQSGLSTLQDAGLHSNDSAGGAVSDASPDVPDGAPAPSMESPGSDS